MGFRARNKDGYNKWRATNLHKLETAGIPQEVVVNDHRFWLVVQEGCDLGRTGWDVSWIDDRQAADLLELLVGFLGDESGWDLVGDLRRKLQRQPPDA